MVWTPTDFDQMLIGRDRARLDIPTMSRPSLKDVSRRLHELANTLQRLSMHGPTETLSDRSALMLARAEVHAAQANLKAIWKRELELRKAFKAEAVKKIVNLRS